MEFTTWQLFAIFCIASQNTRALDIRVQCLLPIARNPIPVPNLILSLREPGYIFGTNQINETTTNWLGEAEFLNPTLDASDSNTTHYTLRVLYEFADAFRITNDLKITRSEDFSVPRNALAQIWTITLRRSFCQTFLSMTIVWYDFLENVNRTRHPCGILNVIPDTYVSLMDTSAFASTDTIRILETRYFYPDLAYHEFAHTIRHCLDGSFLHFLKDVFKYNYIASHWCGKITNQGFAFNEGFASYWANECTNRNEAITDQPFDSESYVSYRLMDLGTRCHGPHLQKARFYELLEANPGKIHTFLDFLNAHKERYGCE